MKTAPRRVWIGLLTFGLLLAFVASDLPVRLSPEHDASEWLPLEAARVRVTWPRAARALEDAGRLLAGGTAGTVEDVLRVW